MKARVTGLAGIALLFSLSGCGQVTQAEDPLHDRGERPAGAKVHIRKDGKGQIPAALTAGAFNQLNLSLKAKDQMGMQRLADAGLVIALTRPTAALYLEADYDASVVRLTEGPHKGEKVWVYPFTVVTP